MSYRFLLVIILFGINLALKNSVAQAEGKKRCESTKFSEIDYSEPKILLDSVRYRILFNEIMFDPIPSVGLPEVEYFELLNISDKVQWFSGFQICDESQCIDLPAMMLFPDDPVAFCKSAELQAFDDTINVVGLLKWITLTNNGKWLKLQDSLGVVWDSIYYLPSQHESGKSGGGWSLEARPGYKCSSSGRFGSSQNARGGTPGSANSLNQESSALELHQRLGSLG